jgi:hypothetical protein
MKVKLQDREWDEEYTLQELKAVVQELVTTHSGLEIAFAVCKVNHERKWGWQGGVNPDMVSERAIWQMASHMAYVNGFDLKSWKENLGTLNVCLKRLPGAMSRSGGPSTIYAQDKAGRVFKQAQSENAFYWRTDDQVLAFLCDAANCIASQRVELEVCTREDEFEGRLVCDTTQLKRHARRELGRQSFVEACEEYRFDQRPEDERRDDIVKQALTSPRDAGNDPPSPGANSPQSQAGWACR